MKKSNSSRRDKFLSELIKWTGRSSFGALKFRKKDHTISNVLQVQK